MQVKTFIFYAAAILGIGVALAWLLLTREGSKEQGNGEQYEEQILARVDGREIRAKDVNRFINYHYRGKASDNGDLEQLRRQALDELILIELIVQEASRRNIKLSDNELENEVRNNRDDVDDYLQGRNISLDDFKIELSAIMLKNKVEASILTELKAVVTVSSEEVRRYYELNREMYATVEAAHIYIRIDRPVGPDEVAAAKTKAIDIISQLNDGAVFEELAKQFSDDAKTKNTGGNLGQIQRNSFVSQAFEDVAFQLESGEYSDEPVRVQDGFHIIKCLDKRYSPFEEVQEQIRNQLLLPKMESAFNEYLDSLRSDSDIEIFLD